MRSALDSLLSGLNREQLQSLLLKLTEQEPSVLATIERQASAKLPALRDEMAKAKL
jgi:hypothetical protein